MIEVLAITDCVLTNILDLENCPKHMNYKILYDHDKPLVFVGHSYHNRCLNRYFSPSRSSQLVSIEELEQQSQTWLQDHQFMCVMSNVSFRLKVKNFFKDVPADLFSVVSADSVLGHNVTIGRSTLINHKNVLYDDAKVGDFSCITNFVMISHEVIIGDLCHIAPYGYFSFCSIGHGNFVGINNQFFGYPETKILTPAWCNFYANGRLTESVASSGTWAGRKLVDDRTSLELAL
jgi:acetyltransferase-like isoleucine patch superfamily enzyme